MSEMTDPGSSEPSDLIPDREEPFYSANALWEFDPETLTQRRPPVGSDDYVTYIFQDKLSMDHERTHWLQFCGTTIGVTLLTLKRMEDVAVLKIFLADDENGEIRDFAAHRLANRHESLAAQAVDSSGYSDRLNHILQSMRDSRVCRAALLGTLRGGLTTAAQREAVSRALAAVDDVYSLHTGRRRPGVSMSIDYSFARDNGTGQIPPDNTPELTLRHLLESDALLNELGPILITGWGGWRLRTGTPFTELAGDGYHHVSDRLNHLSHWYSRCLDYVFSQWAVRPGIITGDRPNDLARIMLALACCFDVALNPPVGPLCRPADLSRDELCPSWDDLYPPVRFMAAVRAVTAEGILDTWPDMETYRSYRERILELSGLSLGAMRARSFQHPGFSGTFFKEAGPDDELVARMSYFDYLIWAMESLHVFRDEYPLVAALPFTMMFNWEEFSNYSFQGLAEESVCFGAPLYWVGDTYSWHRDLSGAVGIRITMDLCILHILKHLVLKAGPAELEGSFPGELLRIASFQDRLLRTLGELTGVADPGQLVSLPHGHEGAGDRAEVSNVNTAIEWAPPDDAVIRTVRITRREVEGLLLDPLMDVMAELFEDPLANRSSLELEFSGYDADPRGLWDIPEVRSYLRSFNQAFPLWPWYFYINPEPGQVIAFALMFFSYLDNPRRITKEESVAWLKEVFRALNFESERAGADQEINTEMSDMIFESVKSFTRLRLL